MRGFGWALLVLAGGVGLGELNSEVLTLKAANHALVQAIEAQTRVIDQLRGEVARLAEENAFLRECLSRPLPWPGGALCPKR